MFHKRLVMQECTCGVIKVLSDAQFSLFKFSLGVTAVELIATVATDGVHRDQGGPGVRLLLIPEMNISKSLDRTFLYTNSLKLVFMMPFQTRNNQRIMSDTKQTVLAGRAVPNPLFQF